MFKELIESIQEKRIKGALHKENITPEETEKYNKQLSIIEENRSKREQLEKARSEANFQSQLKAIKETPKIQAQERKAVEQYRLTSARRTGTLPKQQATGFLGGFDKFLAGTGVAKGVTPVLGNGGVVGGGGRHATGVHSVGGGFDVLGGGRGPSGFSVVGGYPRPAPMREMKVKRRKHKKMKRRKHYHAYETPSQQQPFRII